MAEAYDRRDRGARKKRPRRKAAPAKGSRKAKLRPKRAAKKVAATPKKRAKAPVVKTKKRVSKRGKAPIATPKKRVAKKRTKAPVVVPKKRIAKKRTKAPVAPPKKRVAKKRTKAPVAPPKKRVATKTPKAPAVAPRRPKEPTRAQLATMLASERARTKRLVREAEAKAAAATESKLKRRVDRANARLRRRIKDLESLRYDARANPQDGALKRAVAAEQKAIAAQATSETLAIKELPSATPKQEAKSRERNASERLERFFQVFRLAKKTGQLPKHTNLGNRVDSWHQTGVRRTFKVDEILNDAVVTDVMHRAGRISRSLDEKHNYSLWQGYAMISGSGDDLYGSGLSTLDTSKLNTVNVDASTFQTRGYVESGYWNSRLGMLEHLERALERLLSAKNSLVYVHDVTLMYVTRKNATGTR